MVSFNPSISQYRPTRVIYRGMSGVNPVYFSMSTVRTWTGYSGCNRNYVKVIRSVAGPESLEDEVLEVWNISHGTRLSPLLRLFFSFLHRNGGGAELPWPYNLISISVVSWFNSIHSLLMFWINSDSLELTEFCWSVSFNETGIK